VLEIRRNEKFARAKRVIKTALSTKSDGIFLEIFPFIMKDFLDTFRNSRKSVREMLDVQLIFGKVRKTAKKFQNVLP